MRAIRDRVVQGALKLIVEPIFEVDFQAGSCGYRPQRSAHDAVPRVAGAIVSDNGAKEMLQPRASVMSRRFWNDYDSLFPHRAHTRIRPDPARGRLTATTLAGCTPGNVLS